MAHPAPQRDLGQRDREIVMTDYSHLSDGDRRILAHLTKKLSFGIEDEIGYFATLTAKAYTATSPTLPDQGWTADEGHRERLWEVLDQALTELMMRFHAEEAAFIQQKIATQRSQS
jgi:hypothetical protein